MLGWSGVLMSGLSARMVMVSRGVLSAVLDRYCLRKAGEYAAFVAGRVKATFRQTKFEK